MTVTYTAIAYPVRLTWSVNPWPSDEDVEKSRRFGPWRHWAITDAEGRHVCSLGINRDEGAPFPEIAAEIARALNAWGEAAV